MPSERICLDMHVHSSYSFDSILSIDHLIRKTIKSGVIPIICDHDSIKGSKIFSTQLKKFHYDIPTILAEEITTMDGEVIGIFLTEEIDSGYSAAETLDLIHDQGGLTVAPHPFDRYRRKVLSQPLLNELKDKFDLIEGFNGRIIHSEDNKKASEFAKFWRKPKSIGSDAHTPFELGKSYVEIDQFDNVKDFQRVISNSYITTKRSNPGVHILTKFFKVMRR